MSGICRITGRADPQFEGHVFGNVVWQDDLKQLGLRNGFDPIGIEGTCRFQYSLALRWVCAVQGDQVAFV